MDEAHQFSLMGLDWVQGLDLNQGPSGYEPDELPDCSTLQYLKNLSPRLWKTKSGEKSGNRIPLSMPFPSKFGNL